MKKWLVLLILLAGCQHSEVKEQRIISLMPSNTEILYELGVGSHIVGVSTADDYPAAVRKEKQFDSMNLNKEALLAAKPTVIIAYETQRQKVLRSIEDAGVKVIYVKEAKKLSDISSTFEQVGRAVQRQQEAEKLAVDVRRQIAAVTKKYSTDHHRVMMEVSSKPDIYTGGSGTLFNDMMTSLGAENVFGDVKGWKPVSKEAIIRRNPQIIIGTSGMQQAQFEKLVKTRGGFNAVAAVKDNHIYTIESDIISRPGPRIAQGYEALAKTIHND